MTKENESHYDPSDESLRGSVKMGNNETWQVGSDEHQPSTLMEHSKPSQLPRTILVVITTLLAVLGLYLTSLKSYLLFHTLVELSSIVIGFSVLLVVWNARRWLNNNYLLGLGVALAAASILDLVHMLAYKGMNIFTGYDSNLPTQLWIAARYLQSLSMLFALLFLSSTPHPSASSTSHPQEKTARIWNTFWLRFMQPSQYCC